MAAVVEGSSRITMIKKQEEKLEKGDKVNISEILGGGHLISKQHPFQLPSDHLNGKVVVLHFVPLAPWCLFLRQHVDSLVDIYNSIRFTLPFEVVFIGFQVPEWKRSFLKYTMSHEYYFEEKFSIMPWTALPFSHTHSLDYWRTRLRYPMYPDCVADTSTYSLVIDPAGTVLQLRAEHIFLTFGAAAYPFSDERVIHLEHQDQTALNYPSITQLLTSPGHEHLITCGNKEVPVKDLEGKTVALYFYEDCDYPFDWFTEKLKEAYQKLDAKKDNFEVVLVYNNDSIEVLRYASEESFRDVHLGMPWLALPYKHPSCKNLQRIFEFTDVGDPVPRLVIIGPRGEFVEPYGADIVKHFGADAYPFTRKEAVKMEVDSMKKLKLDMFLDPNTCFEKAGSEVKLWQLAGKKIMLIVEVGWEHWEERPNFWSRLTQRYNLMKETGDPFEVIHVPYKDTSGETSSTVPWLRTPPFPKNSDKHELVRGVFRSDIGLVAFDGDGRVVRKTRYPRIQKRNESFPFYDGGLEKEALKDLIRGFGWYDDSELVRGF